MRLRTSILLIAALACLASWAQSQSGALPAAPSTVKQQELQAASTPTPQPTATPAQPQAAASAGAAAQGTPSTQANSATSSPATGATAEQDNPDYTITVHADEVNVVFTATDKHGHFVRDLQQSDISVLDDKLPPEKVIKFSSQTDLPLRVGLVIDISSSIRDRFKFEQEAAIEFLNQIIRPRVDRAFVLGFDTTPDITQDFTGDTEALAKGVRALRPGGGTALFDALYLACRDKLLKERNYPPTRRAIILLSDGDDNQSRVLREEAIEMAQRAEVSIYTISTNISGVKLRGDKILERMADATGGRAFFPFKAEDVADAFTSIQEELRSQYSIAYKPANFAEDGRLRTIEIKSKTKKLQIRSRVSYYAPIARKQSSHAGMP